MPPNLDKEIISNAINKYINASNMPLCELYVHMTDLPALVTYASVMSRETVPLKNASFCALKIMVTGIMNTNITAPNTERIWTSLVPSLTWIVIKIIKSTGAAFQSPLADLTRHLGCMSDKNNPNLRMKVCMRETATVPEKYYSIWWYVSVI